MIKVIPFVIIVCAQNASGHAVMTKVVANGLTSCAVNANDPTCTATNDLAMREVIPRSGNTGDCANPPGCEADFKCDWCGLEKVDLNGLNQVVSGKWWSAMPAAYWDQRQVWPKKPCMSNEQFGARGIVKVVPGARIDTAIYVNADHSGLYRYELVCGRDETNEKFAKGAIQPWRALHKSKEQKAPLKNDRIVGSTRLETDKYWENTVCTGAGCEAISGKFRMNSNVQPPDSQYCKANRDMCYAEDSFTLKTSCRGDAVLRWFWLSAEGPEVYANCLDLNIGDDGTNPKPNPEPSTPDDEDNDCVEITPRKRCAKGDGCRGDPGCCAAGVTCFEKDDYWADCLSSCEPGIHESDPVDPLFSSSHVFALHPPTRGLHFDPTHSRPLIQQVKYRTEWSCTPLAVGVADPPSCSGNGASSSSSVSPALSLISAAAVVFRRRQFQ